MAHRLAQQDEAVARAMAAELRRQRETVELIASENFVSAAVMEAQGGVMTNKYAEGYAGARYYGGCEYVDEVEELACARVKKLFGCGYANVQPHSGSQANQAVLLALAKPGDVLLGMRMDAGGHLTHGSSVNLSGKWFQSVSYGVRKEDERVDYEEAEELARQHRPKVIVVGASAYTRVLDFAKFREIADKVGAYLLADIAHIAGLVATGEHGSPFPHAHAVTSTTHKTLRGPRGGIILTNDEAIAKKINQAVFPGLQGGPLMHVVAAKAVAFGEALMPEYKAYIRAVRANAHALAESLGQEGIRLVAGGTDTHMVLVDLRPLGLGGKEAEARLEEVGITANPNGVPFDTAPPRNPSGVRFGTPACTTRGFSQEDFTFVGTWIGRALKGDAQERAQIAANVRELLASRPLYEEMGS